MPDFSKKWFVRFDYVRPECRGIGALAYREADTEGFIIIVSFWSYAFIAEYVEPLARTMRTIR